MFPPTSKLIISAPESSAHAYGITPENKRKKKKLSSFSFIGKNKEEKKLGTVSTERNTERRREQRRIKEKKRMKGRKD